MARKDKPACCPFCEEEVPRPRPIVELGGSARGGRCSCGAIYIVDETGKAGGQALLDGLTLLCDGDVDRAMGLESGVDYRLERMGYRPKTHGLDPQLPGHGFAKPKLWFMKATT